jgi:hypothetical protein
MSGKKRRPLDREKLRQKPKLKKEWVSISAGDVSVWGMNAAQMLALGERIQRPTIDPRGGVDSSGAVLWLVVFCTHVSDDEESPLVWNEAQLQEVYQLSGDDFTALAMAARRVNGTDEKGLDDARDFTTATGAPSSSDSPSSASSSSGASPANWNTLPTTN